MVADDSIVTFQTPPIGCGGGAMIEVALEHPPKQLTAAGFEEPFDLAMVEVVGGGVMQGGHHISEFLESRGKRFAIVKGSVCLGHKDVSFKSIPSPKQDGLYSGSSLLESRTCGSFHHK